MVSLSKKRERNGEEEMPPRHVINILDMFDADLHSRQDSSFELSIATMKA